MAEFDYEKIRPLLEIPGSIDYDDAVVLFDLALKGPGANEPVVSLGAFKGRETGIMALACAQDGRGSVIAIDDFKQYALETLNKRDVDVGVMLYRNLYKHRVSPWTIIVECKTSVIPAAADRPIRMLYVGGSRYYSGIKENFEAWQDKVIEGGVVVFPEYGSADFPDVEKFVDAEILPAGRFEFEKVSGMLAILRKKCTN